MATNPIQQILETEPLVETNVSSTPSFGGEKAEKLPSPQSDRVGLGFTDFHRFSAPAFAAAWPP